MNNFLRHMSFFAPILILCDKYSGYGIIIGFFNIKRRYYKYAVVKQWALLTLKYYHNNDIYLEFGLFGLNFKLYFKKSEKLNDYIGI